jgi:prevent-host-death family protein
MEDRCRVAVLDTHDLIWSHIVMKKAKVSELKAKLSAYLADVRSGDTIVVCDRRTPIAQLVPYETDADAGGLMIQEASRPVRELFEGSAVRLRKKADLDKILREARGER